MPDKSPERRPFYETIVDAIERACFSELASLGRLIIKTKIPENHVAIIGAWEKASSQNNLPDGVVADLLEQKREAEEKATKKVEEKAEREDRKAATIAEYLLASVELTDEDINRIWDALPGDARVAIQAWPLAELAAQRARREKGAVTS